MVPKFEMSTYFYSNVLWLQSGPKISTLVISKKIFLITLTIFSHSTEGQNNFGNKIPFSLSVKDFLLSVLLDKMQSLCKIERKIYYRVFKLDMREIKRLLGHQKCTLKS